MFSGEVSVLGRQKLESQPCFGAFLGEGNPGIHILRGRSTQRYWRHFFCSFAAYCLFLSIHPKPIEADGRLT